MSDLQCAATILVARHGEATYRHPDRASDIDGGQLTDVGLAQARELARSLRSRRIAAIYTSSMSRAVQTGQVLGTALTLDSAVLAGVQEFSAGQYADRGGTADPIRAVLGRWLAGDLDARCPGGDSARDIIDRFAAALGALGDLHRGETVVVVSHGTAMSLAIPRLCANVSSALSRAHWLPHCAVAPVHVDSTGWALEHWPGSVAPPS